jgi:hypothetical protein
MTKVFLIIMSDLDGRQDVSGRISEEENRSAFCWFGAALSSEEAPARINNRLSHTFDLRAYEMLLCQLWCQYSSGNPEKGVAEADGCYERSSCSPQSARKRSTQWVCHKLVAIPPPV